MGRPPAPLDRAKILEASKLFFSEGLTRDAIAKRMGAQGRNVSIWLDEARKLDIVRIQFAENVADEGELEERLKTKYPNLKRAIIVASDGSDNSYETLPKRWAVAAADYFQHLYNTRPRGKPWHVAVTGNEPLWELALALRDARRDQLFLHIGCLIGHGRLAKDTAHLEAQTVASMIWSRSGRIAGRLEFATVSPYHIPKGASLPTRRKIVAEELQKVQANPTVREVVQGLKKVDAIFGGIGTINPTHVSQTVRNRVTMDSLLHNIITPQELEREGALGDFNYCTYGPTGCQKKEWRFFLTAGHYSKRVWGIEFFKDMAATPGKIVAGFGAMPQLPAIRVALQTGIVNALITDTTTVQTLLEES